ncbi:heparinase II/III family protein [Massilia sp. YIM B04103]|uniref:heparinase II/III domain-containing protein n=1 Tax=Massilia sp. YIM B04103 TaxID=2963106 RepID=UPI00210E8B9C|nr:heparinase II/III family protein [Massilia sp. YIM B04103]
MRMKLLCRLVGAALLLNVQINAMAEMPGYVKAAHPHVGLLKEDVDRVRNSLALTGPEVFPAKQGRISFSMTPRRKVASDLADQPVLGGYQSQKSAFFLRHIDGDSADGKKIRFQLGFLDAALNGTYAAVRNFELEADKEATIELSWNNTVAALTINGTRYNLPWAANAPTQWSAKDQQYTFSGRAGEIIKNFKLWDAANQVVAQHDFLDLELQAPVLEYLRSVDSSWTTLQGCAQTANPVQQDGSICDLAFQGRGTITGAASRFALAYLLTERPHYMAAARRLADQMFLLKDNATPGANKQPLKLAVGGEWAMSSRVGAMGILYDWLYDKIDERDIPTGDAFAGHNLGSYRTLLAQNIKATIAADHVGSSDDLIGHICGQYATLSTGSLDCNGTMSWNESGNPSIAPYYIAGHHQSAVAGTVHGLLAIAHDDASALPLLKTMYGHFENGFVPARAFISVDGGSQAAFAYGLSEMPERVKLWRDGLEGTGSEPILGGDWMAQLIYPYIYGMRHDYSFPARGDNFDLSLRDGAASPMALAAIVDKQDPVALAFYRQQIKVARRSVVGAPWQRNNDQSLLAERLHSPFADYPEGRIESLPLSRHFRVAGLVLMRDSWDYPNATLLDFKSSSFISENHQHMDQNSFALNYKAPLLLDTGLYESYGSRHWSNYYTRTVAHNSVLVFDPEERFTSGSAEFSNDGGQWLHGRPAYPTIRQASPGGSNALHGVTAFEEGNYYSYAVGNASRAYSAGKMDQENGFVREVLFLREAKPVVLVFDRVLTKKNLPATSLLHTATRPVHGADTTSLLNGRYRVNFVPNAARVATVRNGGGMLNVQVLLPQNAEVVQVGSDGGTGPDCEQLPNRVEQAVDKKDCRFMVQQRVSGNTYAWRNYPPQASGQKSALDDVGAWRLEISAPAAPAAGETQYFLNVLDVADADGGNGPVQRVEAARLTAADAGTEAVLLKGSLTVLFNRAATPAGSYSWKAASEQGGALIATGLKRNTRYALSSAKVGEDWVRKLAEDANGTLLSSDAGVIHDRL